MAEKSDTLKRETEELHSPMNPGQRREESLRALQRLREIGEKLPAVDAVLIVRESRDLAQQGSR
ncbi:MAG TPA: hypothetical protein VGO69_01470 [Pyrinomonadaceae bacterium]|jgi:hypothetical protein|nr:hypothetical protein [Pyrinomonadaceae bacterium]